MTGQWKLHEDRRRASSFGDDAERYDRVRPQYPRELIDALMVDRPHTVLDVGCGTGIVARIFLARDCEVVGLEPDERMADVARGSGVTVEPGTIETWDPAGRQFDLLTAGQAWHWVNPHLGAAKAAAVLRPGGRIGLFWNQANPDASVRPALDAAYARHAPDVGQRSVLMGRREASLYDSIADSLRRAGEFNDVAVVRFGHDITYSSIEWVELAASHSDHHTLPPDQLAALLSDVRAEVDQVGGEVPVHYEVTLVTGTRRVEAGF
jgi:SAM-dependent methyltransferase